MKTVSKDSSLPLIKPILELFSCIVQIQRYSLYIQRLSNKVVSWWLHLMTFVREHDLCFHLGLESQDPSNALVLGLQTPNGAKLICVATYSARKAGLYP